jgi:uncharacterized protein DUF6448
MFARCLRVTVTLVTAVLLFPAPARAHCDSLDGPVVKAALRALETGDVNRAFVWVTAFDEAEVRAAFDKALTVRALGGTAKELADQFFFETVVRLHRQSEGEPYTGLKPAGSDLGPLIPAADRAILEMSPKPLVDLLTREVASGVRWHFDAVMAARIFPGASVEAGRRYVAAYLDFMQYVEQLDDALLIPDEYSGLVEQTMPD